MPGRSRGPVEKRLKDRRRAEAQFYELELKTSLKSGDVILIQDVRDVNRTGASTVLTRSQQPSHRSRIQA